MNSSSSERKAKIEGEDVDVLVISAEEFVVVGRVGGIEALDLDVDVADVEAPAGAVVTEAEREGVAVVVGKQRAGVLDRLRRLVPVVARPNRPRPGELLLQAYAVGPGVIPVGLAVERRDGGVAREGDQELAE